MENSDTPRHDAHARQDAKRSSAPVLDCYDDLDASCAYAWQLLSRGARDRRHPLHTPCVANVGLSGQPEVRTVVLRGADDARWELTFHTDVRSRKFAALQASADISLLGYDPGAKVQLRCSGRASLHHRDETAAAGWIKSQATSRVCYQQAQAPGAMIASANEITLDSLDEARHNFAVVKIAVAEIEWLYLAAAGHRRARFLRGAGERIVGHWLAP